MTEKDMHGINRTAYALSVERMMLPKITHAVLNVCQRNLKKVSNGKKNNTEKHREYQRLYQRNLRAYRKENGLCQQCGKPTQNGYVFCTEHLAARRIKQESRRRQQGIIPRWMFGNGELCTFCGKPVANKGDKCCPICLERERKWSAEQRKKIDYENTWFRISMPMFFNKRRNEE